MANLTDRNSFKRYAGIKGTSNDALIDALIDAGTKRIERLAGRKFCATDYREWQDGPDAELRMRNWPTIRVDRVMTGECPALKLKYTGSDILATVTVFQDAEHETTGIRLSTLSAAGTSTNTEKLFANFLTVSLMVAELNSIADWTVSQPGNDWTILDLHPLSNLDALGMDVHLTRPDQLCQYRVNSRAGLIELEHLRDATIHMGMNPYARPHRNHRAILIVYRAGFDTIPTDVEQMANEFVQFMFAGRQNTGQVTQETIGEWSYTLANNAELTETQMNILRPYMELR